MRKQMGKMICYGGFIIEIHSLPLLISAHQSRKHERDKSIPASHDTMVSGMESSCEATLSLGHSKRPARYRYRQLPPQRACSVGHRRQAPRYICVQSITPCEDTNTQHSHTVLVPTAGGTVNHTSTICCRECMSENHLTRFMSQGR